MKYDYLKTKSYKTTRDQTNEAFKDAIREFDRQEFREFKDLRKLHIYDLRDIARYTLDWVPREKNLGLAIATATKGNLIKAISYNNPTYLGIDMRDNDLEQLKQEITEDVKKQIINWLREVLKL